MSISFKLSDAKVDVDGGSLPEDSQPKLIDSLPHLRRHLPFIHSFIYLFIKHIHIDGRKQSNGTGQQGTHSTLTVGLHRRE